MTNQLTDQENSVLNYLDSAGWDYAVDEDYVVVYESELPYLFIEFNENIDLEWDSAFCTDINNQYRVSFFAVTDGVKAKVYHFGFGVGIYFTDIHSIEGFLKIPSGNLEVYDIYRRIDVIDFLFEEATVDEFINSYIISDMTEEYWQKRFAEFANALFYEVYEPTNRKLPIQIVQDLKLEYISTKNASGGGYEGLHRKFLVKLPDGAEVPFVISLFATAGTVNDPVYGNRTGTSQLNIAIIDKPNSTYNLQVNLDRFIDVIGNEYEIWHNGIRSRLKKEYVLNTVQEIAPLLMDGDRIKLGRFPLKNTINVASFSTFIENLIMYSYSRKQADIKYRK